MTKEPERIRIAQQASKRPYAARISCLLSDSSQVGFTGASSLLLDSEHIIEIHPSIVKTGSHDAQRLNVTVLGFARASDAENAGLKISSALLWLAVSLRCPLRLEYHTPLPSIVFDRTNQSLSVQSSAHATLVSNPSSVVEVLKEVYLRNEPFERQLIVSMELFAAARLEVTERTRFLGLVSALEPIAIQEQYGEPIVSLARQFLTILSQTNDVPPELRPSLEGRIRDLRRESVSRAIRRLVETHLAGDVEAQQIIKEAYDVRSKIVHEGLADADLDELSAAVEGVIRNLYSALLNIDLKKP